MSTYNRNKKLCSQLNIGNYTMISVIEELMLAPCMSNVNENGFSVSWDYSRIGQYYMWLCRKYGVAPDNEVVAALGLSTITDKSDIW